MANPAPRASEGVKLRVTFVAPAADGHGPSSSGTPVTGSVYSLTVHGRDGLAGLLAKLQSRAQSQASGPASSWRISFQPFDAAGPTETEKVVQSEEDFQAMCEAYATGAKRSTDAAALFRLRLRVQPPSMGVKSNPACRHLGTPPSTEPAQKRSKRHLGGASNKGAVVVAQEGAVVTDSQLMLARLSEPGPSPGGEDAEPESATRSRPSSARRFSTEAILRSIVRTVDRHHTRFFHARLNAVHGSPIGVSHVSPGASEVEVL